MIIVEATIKESLTIESSREALIDVIQQAMLEELKKGDRDPDRSFSAAVLKAIEEDHLIIPKSQGVIALNPMSDAPKDKWIVLYNEFTGFYLSRWSDEKKSYPLYDLEQSEGVWYPGPSGWLPLCHQPKAAIFSKTPAGDIAELANPLEWIDESDRWGKPSYKAKGLPIVLRKSSEILRWEFVTEYATHFVSVNEADFDEAVVAADKHYRAELAKHFDTNGEQAG